MEADVVFEVETDNGDGADGSSNDNNNISWFLPVEAESLNQTDKKVEGEGDDDCHSSIIFKEQPPQHKNKNKNTANSHSIATRVVADGDVLVVGVDVIVDVRSWDLSNH
jgi:hypothetical protein